MARIAEDEVAGLERRLYPQPGEVWRLRGSETMVDVWRLHTSDGCYAPGDVMRVGEILATFWSSANHNAQCVVYKCGEVTHIRHVENFLRNFEFVRNSREINHDN